MTLQIAAISFKFSYLFHCLKSVRIRSYSGPNDGSFGPNTGRYSVSLHIQSEFLQCSSAKLEAKLCGRMMAMKSFFIDELHTIKSESLKSANIRNTSTNNDYSTVDSLQTKINFLEAENKYKQKPMDAILEYYSDLIQAQVIFAQRNSVIRKTNDKSVSHTTGENDFQIDKKN